MPSETVTRETRTMRIVTRLPRMLTEADDYSWVPLGDVLVAIANPDDSEVAYPEGKPAVKMTALLTAGRQRRALLRIFDMAEDRPDIREVARVALTEEKPDVV